VGVKERRERNRTEMRAAMLTAVREIAATEGWQTVSIRKIAERIEYSPTLLYQYFESKDAVVHEVRRQGYEDLLARLIASIKRETDPRSQLRLMARANIDIAFEQPEVFKAMLGMDGTPCDPPPGATAHHEIAKLIRRTIEQAASNSTNVDSFTEAYFCAVQGVITMYLNDLLHGGRKRATKTVDRIVEGLTAGWFGQPS
jgi:AcrR family transcriptional regulator